MKKKKKEEEKVVSFLVNSVVQSLNFRRIRNAAEYLHSGYQLKISF